MTWFKYFNGTTPGRPVFSCFFTDQPSHFIHKSCTNLRAVLFVRTSRVNISANGSGFQAKFLGLCQNDV